MHIIVKACEGEAKGTLTYNDTSVACALGPAGLTTSKVEGDGATPVGDFRLLKVFYRPDRIAQIDTALPVTAITKQDGWSDDPKDKAYNSKVTLPYTPSHERLWREDHAYDICVVLNYNINPAIPGRGSAIFFHLAKSDAEGLTATEGCIAITLDVMLDVLKKATTETSIRIDFV